MTEGEDERTHLYHSLNEARLLDARAVVQAGLSINGLATTAVLALLAAIAAKPGNHIPRDFLWSLGSFGFGILCAACTAVAAYIANHRYAEASSPFAKEADRPKSERTATIAHYIGYGTAGGMLVGFLFGVVFAILGFICLK